MASTYDVEASKLADGLKDLPEETFIGSEEEAGTIAPPPRKRLRRFDNTTSSSPLPPADAGVEHSDAMEPVSEIGLRLAAGAGLCVPAGFCFKRNSTDAEDLQVYIDTSGDTKGGLLAHNKVIALFKAAGS